MAADLKSRIQKVLLNGKETEIADITINGTTVTVLTKREEDVSHIESVQIIDDQDHVITERSPDLMSAPTGRLISDLHLRWWNKWLIKKRRTGSRMIR